MGAQLACRDPKALCEGLLAAIEDRFLLWIDPCLLICAADEAGENVCQTWAEPDIAAYIGHERDDITP